MSDYKSAAFVEGKPLGGDWHYRINRATRLDGEQVYAVLLTYEDPSNRGRKLHVWLSEFGTLEQARDAAHSVLSDMTIYMNRIDSINPAHKS
jgi:hypothetical protein